MTDNINSTSYVEGVSDEAKSPEKNFVLCGETTDILPTLESLPSDIIPIISQYLTVRDLGACCETSIKTRELFQSDPVWKPHCTKDLAQYLSITPCKVQPVFTIPKSSKNLKEISTWRLAYMRENHFLNNWKQGKCVTEKVSIMNREYIEFYCNDYLVVKYPNSFEILDVRGYPAQTATEPVCSEEMFGGTDHDFDVKVYNEKIIVTCRTLVLIYEVDFSIKKCVLQHAFFYNKSSEEPLDNSHVSKFQQELENNEESQENAKLYVIEGSFFVGIHLQSTIHIWNYGIRVKLRQEHCPHKIYDVYCSKAMTLVCGVDYNKGTKQFIAYSLTRLIYLPLNVTSYSIKHVTCLMNHLIIHKEGMSFIYDCENSKLILKQSTLFECRPCVMHGRILLVTRSDGQLIAFDPAKRIYKKLPINDLREVNMAHDRFIQIRTGNISCWWIIDKSFKVVKQTAMKWSTNLISECTLNEVATRRLISTEFGKSSIRSFW